MSFFYVSKKPKIVSFIGGFCQVISGLLIILTLGWIGTSLNLWFNNIDWKKIGYVIFHWEASNDYLTIAILVGGLFTAVLWIVNFLNYLIGR